MQRHAGQEPWRTLSRFRYKVVEELDLSAAEVNRLRDVQREYNKKYIQVRARCELPRWHLEAAACGAEGGGWKVEGRGSTSSA